MGCCASTSYKAVSIPQQRKCRSSAARSDVSSYSSKAAPPPPEEEETVKEVLSETRTLKKPAISKVDNEEKKRDHNKVDDNPLMTTEPEVSEASDIYSSNESVSTVTEKREDNENGEVRQRVDGSPAMFRIRALSGNVRERTTTAPSNSPARKSELYPIRVGSLPGREKCAAATDWQRLDNNKGDVSGRRSRSPATRAAEVGGARAGLGRQTGKSPGRVRPNVPDSTRRIEETPPTAKETLENPLVSLECFIFL